jgi:quercetin dioxygenase-like cupin family protein
VATALLSFENFVDQRLSRALWFSGALMIVHADAASTNGMFGLVEMSGGPGTEPPLHVHANEDEFFYVLEGRLKVIRGDEQMILEAGDSAFLPRNVAHTFTISSDQARWLVYITPGGFEGYFQTLGKPAEVLLPETSPAKPDIPRMVRVGHQFGLTFPR